ncbi:MAG: endonuclease/exonuclease/phosphatase family protein [Candidatus Paceibacterota bacterium]|jgi:endonuclease/exonuclease/phosphatase family metal-dependent hydrolase
MQIKILSWNIWIEGKFNQVKDFLKTCNADIIGLQEVQADIPERNIIDYLESLGYQHVFAPIKKTWGGKIWNDGPAVFSKYKIINAETYILSEVDGRAAARADIQIKNKVLHVFSTHLIHTHQQESEEQNEQVKNLIKVLPQDNLVVIGDFNAAPDSTAIKSMQNVLIDTDPLSLPTWSVYPEGCLRCNPQTIDIRLDYIFTSKDVKTNSFKVEDSKSSDHLPISINIEI